METPNNNQQTTGLQIFFKEDIDANVRVKVINGAPWFVGKDVAASLGYTKTRNAISQHVDNEDALKQGVPDNQGFIQETILINESGMYALIFGSKLPTAKAFKRWVTNEVLPSIRRTGALRSSDTASDASRTQVPSGLHRMETGCVPLSQPE